MGLDVYLYTKEQQDKQNAFDTKWGDSYPDRDTQPARYKAWHEAYSALPTATNVKSERYPTTINNRRYLRSSYNGGGFNNWVPNITRDDRYQYYWVFEPVSKGSDDYLIECTDVDLLLQCRERAVEIVDALEKAKNAPVYNVITESPTPLGSASEISAEQALAVFDGEQKRNEDSSFSSSYSNRAGAFWLDSPLQVVAAINGRDVLGQPALHLIYKDDFAESYLESAHVLVEFCDELISLVKADGAAYIHWSG